MDAAPTMDSLTTYSLKHPSSRIFSVEPAPASALIGADGQSSRGPDLANLLRTKNSWEEVLADDRLVNKCLSSYNSVRSTFEDLQDVKSKNSMSFFLVAILIPLRKEIIFYSDSLNGLQILLKRNINSYENTISSSPRKDTPVPDKVTQSFKKAVKSKEIDEALKRINNITDTSDPSVPLPLFNTIVPVGSDDTIEARVARNNDTDITNADGSEKHETTDTDAPFSPSSSDSGPLLNSSPLSPLIDFGSLPSCETTDIKVPAASNPRPFNADNKTVRGRGQGYPGSGTRSFSSCSNVGIWADRQSLGLSYSISSTSSGMPICAVSGTRRFSSVSNSFLFFIFPAALQNNSFFLLSLNLSYLAHFLPYVIRSRFRSHSRSLWPSCPRSFLPFLFFLFRFSSSWQVSDDPKELISWIRSRLSTIQRALI